EGMHSPDTKQVIDLWGRALDAIGSGDLGAIETEIDWAITYRLIERYRPKHGLALTDARIQQIDLAYHDINRRRGLFYLLQRHGRTARVSSDVEIFEAKGRALSSVRHPRGRPPRASPAVELSEARGPPPQTTRAKLRGDFIRAAQA